MRSAHILNAVAWFANSVLWTMHASVPIAAFASAVACVIACFIVWREM